MIPYRSSREMYLRQTQTDRHIQTDRQTDTHTLRKIYFSHELSHDKYEVRLWSQF